MTDETIEGIDICIPTYNSADLLPEALNSAAASFEYADIAVNRLLVADGGSVDGTLATAERLASEHGWPLVTLGDDEGLSLPMARQRLARNAETEWFWFLDDDVRVRENYLSNVVDTIGPKIGAVQGRKASRTEHPSDWVRRRARRGGTHATLIRSAAVTGLSIPSGITVLEDEWIRRWIDSKGYVWLLNHLAEFEHDSQHRHPIGWTEGRVAGAYGLKPFHEVALNVVFAVITGRNPLPHIARTAGWVAGRLNHRYDSRTTNSDTASHDEGGEQ